MSSPIQEFPDLDGLLNVLVGPILGVVPRWSMSGGHQPLLQGPRPIRADGTLICNQLQKGEGWIERSYLSSSRLMRWTVPTPT